MRLQQFSQAERAKRLVELGYWVILLESRDSQGVCRCPEKDNCKHADPHPVTRRKSEPLITRDPAQAHEWWTKRSDCEIGLLTKNFVAFECENEDAVRELSRYGNLGQSVCGRGVRQYFLFHSARTLESKDCVAAIEGVRFCGKSDWILAPTNLELSVDAIPELTPALEVLVSPAGEGPSRLEFPTDVFPDVIQEFIAQSSKSLQCSATIIAANVLAVAAGAIGAARSAEIKQGRIARSSLYLAVVAEPGAGKTPAARQAKAPLDEIQTAWSDHYAAQLQDYERERRKFSLLKEHWEERFREFLRSEASDPGDPPEAPTPPSRRQLFTTDSTIEALVQLLAENNGSLLCWHDELRNWLFTANRAPWLEFWSFAPTMVNRKHSDRPVMIRRPVVNVFGNIPPELIKRLGTMQQSDGFIDRILFCHATEPRECDDGDFTMDERVEEDYRSVIKRLITLRDDRTEEEVLKLTDGARQIFFEWVRRHRNQIRHRGIPPLLRGVLAKIEEYAARFCLILHLLRRAEDNSVGSLIDEESVIRAIRLAEYFKNQSSIMMKTLSAPKDESKIESALSWIQSKGAIVSVRNLQRNNVAGVHSAAEASAVFALLEQHGYGTIVSAPRNRVLFSLKKQYVAYELDDLRRFHDPADVLTWLRNC